MSSFTKIATGTAVKIQEIGITAVTEEFRA